MYRGEFQLGLDLHAHLQGDITGLTTALYDLETHSVNNFLPQQFVLGGSWQLAKNVRGTFDATWVNWSAYVPPVAQLDVVLDIPPPAGGWPATISPPQAVAPTRIVPLRMHDRIIPHVGAEWHALATRHFDGFLRGGYEYSKTPIEPQTGLTNYVDRDRHTFSLGLGVTASKLTRVLPASLSLDLHAALSELVEETTRKASAADLVGRLHGPRPHPEPRAHADRRVRRLSRLVALSGTLLLALSCATTGASGEGDRNLPTVGVGPFRKLAASEVKEIAPFVFDDRVAIYREPAVLVER